MDRTPLAPFAMVALMVLAEPIAPAWAPRPAADAALPQPPQAAAAAPGTPARKVGAGELKCLALNVYWESRGQPLSGQAAVAHVTLNRVSSPSFPASICGVVHQGCQFGWTCDQRSDVPADPVGWAGALAVAQRALDGEPDPTGGALYFHQTSEHPQWVRGRYGHRVTIGQHIFFNVRDGSERQVAQAFDP